MSTNDMSKPVRRVQAGSLQVSVSYNGMVHDEDAGYPFSQFWVTINDPDPGHDVPGHEQMLMLDGDHWTLDAATIEAVCFLATDATGYADPSAPNLDLPGTYVPSYTDLSVPGLWPSTATNFAPWRASSTALMLPAAIRSRCSVG